MVSRIEVDLPWDLKTIEFTDTIRVQPDEDVVSQIEWLRDSTVGTGFDEQLERVFIAAALLHQKFPHKRMVECLDQAIIWERG
jgi:hypothetical protein